MLAAVANARFLLVGRCFSREVLALLWFASPLLFEQLLPRVISKRCEGCGKSTRSRDYSLLWISLCRYMRVLHFHTGGLAQGPCWGSFNSELPPRPIVETVFRTVGHRVRYHCDQFHTKKTRIPRIHYIKRTETKSNCVGWGSKFVR